MSSIEMAIKPLGGSVVEWLGRRTHDLQSRVASGRARGAAPYCTKCTVWGVVSKRVFDPT